ncbi:helix-turn-helix domain-containing protein [Effusibacillus dendaii]|uniref:Transposase putative helix-turn-helix domain-containing protein n=1 Tax=Effusibacillus dendaii TaxID=2743772 RepID=A0A7I8DDI9_9BACL|nr:helix-turn-helix domain-containing protein [Effusibacillus dendaii]BCJ88258.1 hypothetical protein skT53_32430 [Effusibacillus dendaii]
MLRSHKIALQPNNKQSTYFAKACGVARFAFNWGLADMNTTSRIKQNGRIEQLSIQDICDLK